MRKKANTGGVDFFLYLVIIGLVGLTLYLLIFGDKMSISMNIFGKTVKAYDPEELLDKGKASYEDEYFSDASKNLEKLIKHNPFDMLTREAYLMLALSSGADEKKRKQSIKYFEKIRDEYFFGNAPEIDFIISGLESGIRNDEWKNCNLGDTFGSMKVYGICPDSLSGNLRQDQLLSEEDITNLPRTVEEILNSITDEDKKECGYKTGCADDMYCPCVKENVYDYSFKKYVKDFEETLNNDETVIVAYCTLNELSNWWDRSFFPMFQKISLKDQKEFKDAFEKCKGSLSSNNIKSSRSIEFTEVEKLCNKYEKYLQFSKDMLCLKRNNAQKQKYALCLLDRKGLNYNDYQILRNIN